MPGAERAEIYFISAMMILIVILSVAASWFFFKTYKKEMREKALRKKPPTDEKGVLRMSPHLFFIGRGSEFLWLGV